MKRIFNFKKGERTEDLVDTTMMDFLLDYLCNDCAAGYLPTFKDNFKVIITIKKIGN